ncbi:hypothetical protein GGQ85_000226 [Nitrobacter vulgaris]|nr:hypothetical protein [Nitrobacter vulgaris]
MPLVYEGDEGGTTLRRQKRGMEGQRLAPNNNHPSRKSDNGTTGGDIAGAVVLLMVGLLFFSNGRSIHAKSGESTPIPQRVITSRDELSELRCA